jgi:hypothetical protein
LAWFFRAFRGPAIRPVGGSRRRQAFRLCRRDGVSGHRHLSDLPPLYRVGSDGKTVELINYHVEARRLVVDRLFDRGELRLGGKRRAQAVRLTRLTPPTEASR